MNSPIKQILPEAAREARRKGALAPPLEKQRLLFYLLQLLTDLAVISLSFWLAAHTYFGEAWDERTELAALVLMPLFVTIALFNATYSLGCLTDWRSATSKMLVALAISSALLFFVAFYTKSSATFSRGTFTLGIAFSAILLGLLRLAFTHFVRRKYGPKMINELVIEDGGPLLQLPGAYHVRAGDHGLSPSLADPHGLDRLGNYMRNMDHVIVCCESEKRQEWSLVLKAAGVNGEVVSEMTHQIGAIGVRNYDGAGLSSLIVSTGPLGMRARAGKRLFDIALSSLGILLLSPIIAIIALAILVTDGRPVLFRQRRLGRGNRFFNMYKFRTMAVDSGDPDGNRSTEREDARVTRLGRFLRKTSMDELPQLFSVLTGEMSIVGPRPHAIGSQAGSKLFWEVDSRYRSALFGDGKSSGHAAVTAGCRGSACLSVDARKAGAQIDHQAASGQRIASAPELDPAGHHDQTAIEIIGCNRTAGGFIAAGDLHAAGRIEALQLQAAIVAEGQHRAGCAQVEALLPDLDIARKHHAILAILQFDPVSAVVDSCIAVMRCDRLGRELLHTRQHRGGCGKGDGRAPHSDRNIHSGLHHGILNSPGTIRRRAFPSSTITRSARSASIRSAENVPAGIAPSTLPSPIRVFSSSAIETSRAVMR